MNTGYAELTCDDLKPTEEEWDSILQCTRNEYLPSEQDAELAGAFRRIRTGLNMDAEGATPDEVVEYVRAMYELIYSASNL